MSEQATSPTQITRGLAVFLEEADILTRDETSLIIDGLKCIYQHGSQDQADNAIVLLARWGTLDASGLRRLFGPRKKEEA